MSILNFLANAGIVFFILSILIFIYCIIELVVDGIQAFLLDHRRYIGTNWVKDLGKDMELYSYYFSDNYEDSFIIRELGKILRESGVFDYRELKSTIDKRRENAESKRVH